MHTFIEIYKKKKKKKKKKKTLMALRSPPHLKQDLMSQINYNRSNTKYTRVCIYIDFIPDG